MGDGDARCTVRQGGQDLGPVIPVGALSCRPSSAHLHGEQRQHQCAGVRQHVPGVRQRCERARQHASNHLKAHVQDDKG